MMALQTSLNARDLPENLKTIRAAIERAVPHGRTDHGGKGDRRAWHDIPVRNANVWETLKPAYDLILQKHPRLNRGNDVNHLGTLGTGNHFIEVCLDEAENVWLMLHSGSRGVGNRIGTYFIELAKRDMQKFFINLPDQDLAYFPERTEHFDDYVKAVGWAQDYARWNRQLMMDAILSAIQNSSESFNSCSHGAGRAMSRSDVIDETPAAYKPIDAVMAAQEDLVEIVHTLRQVVCVKG